MTWLLLCMVIFVTFAALILGVGALLERGNRELDRLRAIGQLEQAVARAELPHAGRFEVEYLTGPPFAGAQDRGYELPDPGPGYRFAYGQPPYGPFPADTGPLLLLSDKMAAEVALERDVRAMIEAGEEKIPPRWRS